MKELNSILRPDQESRNNSAVGEKWCRRRHRWCRCRRCCRRRRCRCRRRHCRRLCRCDRCWSLISSFVANPDVVVAVVVNPVVDVVLGPKMEKKNSGFSRHILVNKLKADSCCCQRRCGFRRRRRCRCRRSWCGWCWCWPIARIEQTSFHLLFLSPSPPLITNPRPMDRKEVRISTSWKCTFHNWITSTHSSYTAGLKYRHCEFL